jgi:hypothetical protein
MSLRFRKKYEDSFNIYHNISISIAAVGETGASGEMVSGAMVQGAGREH